MSNADRPAGFKVIMPVGQTAPMLTFVAKDAVPMQPGDAVIMGTDGKIDIALSTSTEIFGVCQSKVNGVTTVVENVLVIPAAGHIFSGQCSDDPVAQIGKVCDIVGSTGIMEIVSQAHLTGVARIVGYEGNIGNEASANARVLFTWNLSQFK